MKKRFCLFFCLCSFLLSYSNPDYFIKGGLGHDFILQSYLSWNGSSLNGGSVESVLGEEIIGADEYNPVYTIDDFESYGRYKAYIIEKGDINGDGMDDIIEAYHLGVDHNNDGFGDASIMVVYDGNSKDTLFTRTFPTPGQASFIVKTGDFDNDGKDEIAHVRHSSIDILHDDGIADGSFLQIIDYDEHSSPKIIGAYTGESYGTLVTHQDGIKYLEVGDVNGDGYDDLTMIHYTDFSLLDSCYTSSVLRCLDIKNCSLLFENKLGIGPSSKGYIIKVGNFDSIPETKEILHVRYSGNDDFNLDGNKDNSFIQVFKADGTSIWGYNGWDSVYQVTDKVQIDTNAVISNLEVGDINGDGIDDIALIHKLNHNNDSYYDQTIVKAINIANRTVFFQHDGVNHRFSPTYILKLCNMDTVLNTKEVVFVRRSSNDDDGDQLADNSFLMVYNHLGTAIYGYSPGEGSVGYNNPIIEVQSGKILGNEYDQLIVVHDQDTCGKTVVRIFDVQNNNVISSDIEYSGPLNKLLILRNEISDEEFMKSINYPDSLSISDYIQNYKETFGEKINSYYSHGIKNSYRDSVDNNLFSSINDYSWVSYKDKYYDNGWTTPSVRYISGTTERLDRIYRQLLCDLNDPNYACTDNEIIICLKSLLGIIRFLQDDRHYNFYSVDQWTNHGLMYYHRQILFSFPLLKGFKELEKWESNSVEKLSKQIDDHLLDDGMHAEHAFSYGFYWLYTFLEVAEMMEKNPGVYKNDSLPIKIREEMKNMYTYYLYAIKPLESIRVYAGNYQTDLPGYGDTFAPVPSGWLGKTNNDFGDLSILNIPLVFPSGSPLIDTDSLLGKELQYASNSGSGDIPESTSKYFNKGGELISRSNWGDSNGSLDINARHSIFKFSDFNDDITSKAHRHADLLSVELCGYNKNYIIDPMGYGANTSNSIDSAKYYGIYKHNNLNNDPYDLTRNYFIGTSVHNTVYINGKSQLMPEYSYNSYQTFMWEDINSIALKYDSTAQSDKVKILPEYDYASAGYYKTNGLRESHERSFVYVKPQDNINDYWAIIDNIGFDTSIDTVKLEQTWHIAPYVSDNSDIELDSTNNIVHIENRFHIIPLSIRNNISSRLVNTYYCPLDTLVPSISVKYDLNISNRNNGQYLTLIYPDPNNEMSDICIEQINLYKYTSGIQSYTILNDSLGIGYHLSYEKGGKVYNEYCCVVKDTINQYYWDLNKNNTINNESSMSIIGNLEYVPYGKNFVMLRFEGSDSLIGSIGYELNDINNNITIRGDNQHMNNNWDVVGPDGSDNAYIVRLSQNSDVIFSLCNNYTNFDAKVEIRDQYNNYKGFNDDYCELKPQIRINNLQVGLYYVIIDGYSGQKGNFEVNISVVPRTKLISEWNTVEKEEIDSSMSVSINISKGVISIDHGIQDIKEVILYNVDGKELRTFKKQTKIDISWLQDGFYIIKIITDSGIVIKKIAIFDS